MRATTLLFAVAAGLSVANIYYAQPLLDAMAQDLGIAPAATGLVVTLTQVGYALGLVFIVPLGDLVDRRRLIVGQASLSALALILVATAATASIVFAGMAVIGLLAVVVQVLVAFAATLATPSGRGKAVGTVTSGVVIGILGARFAAGVLADLGGWRAVYLTSAVLTLCMAGLLLRVLPRGLPPASRESYGIALRSSPTLFLRDRVLLVRGLLALLIFAAFSTFWTALVLPLSQEPFSYSHAQIGLFGLVGIAGALAASGAGRLADRGLGQWTTGLSLTLLAASWGLIAFLPRSVPFLLAGVILLDLAVQAVHVTNQSIILARYPNASSRLVGGYMVFYSVGSAIGAIGATMTYDQAGWNGVCGLGAVFSAVALFIWVLNRSSQEQSGLGKSAWGQTEPYGGNV
ncbi:MFS transporter [Microvirga rosea]|uniref:MFS transporter n=1 Tax=Microvirga rosea TaxID=2715425 RepID=UPI001D0BAFCE|nr:MFS transporter [Microvirga rosea]MCB8822828.1 MFS transporter [Microvirga rosea]